jgi:hypothetical protein
MAFLLSKKLVLLWWASPQSFSRHAFILYLQTFYEDKAHFRWQIKELNYLDNHTSSWLIRAYTKVDDIYILMSL